MKKQNSETTIDKHIKLIRNGTVTSTKDILSLFEIEQSTPLYQPINKQDQALNRLANAYWCALHNIIAQSKCEIHS